MPERLLTNREVCERLAVSRTQLHYMTRRGEFPEPIRIGRSLRYREIDVDAWIAALASPGPDGDSETSAPPSS